MLNPRVLLRYDCEECGGSGTVYHPEIEAFYEKYNPIEFKHDGTDPKKPDVPMFIPCPKCKGRKWFQRWIPLAELGYKIQTSVENVHSEVQLTYLGDERE